MESQRIRVRTTLARVFVIMIVVVALALPGSVGASGGAGSAGDLNADVGGWQVPYCEKASRAIDCADPRAPTSDPPRILATPSLDGQALRLAHNDGTGYGNIMYQYKLAAFPEAASATAFTLDLQFLFHAATFQAAEFAITRWVGDQHHDWEVQFDQVRDRPGLAPAWRIWGGDQWVDTGIPATLAPDTWHRLTLVGDIRDGQSHYDGFAIDGVQYTLDRAFAPMAVGGRVITIHVQLDGPAVPPAGGVELFIDQVNLSWGDTVSLSPLGALATATSSRECPSTHAEIVVILGSQEVYWQPHASGAWEYMLIGAAARAPLRDLVVPAGMRLDYWDGQQAHPADSGLRSALAYEARSTELSEPGGILLTHHREW